MKKLNDKALNGVAVIEEMLGADIANDLKNYAVAEHFGSKIAALALEYCYGDNWSEDGLTRREKSLMLIAALTALRQPDELRNHIRLGIANGVAPEELEKILLTLLPYIGFPAASTAQKVMREIMKEQSKTS